jgi:DNA-binding PadR family transcriptional regulator
MFELTGFQRDLLYVIAGLDGPKGLAIKDELELVYGKEIDHGQLYPNLNTLVEKGLVMKEPIDGRANSYSLTDHGYREIDIRQKWEQKYLDDSQPS